VLDACETLLEDSLVLVVDMVSSSRGSNLGHTHLEVFETSNSTSNFLETISLQYEDDIIQVHPHCML